jgi:hypothetical protein
LDPANQRIQQVLTASHGDHGGAAAGELLGGALADPRRRPGQQDAFAVEVNGFSGRPVCR